jgi:membrane dipeptidase
MWCGCHERWVEPVRRAPLDRRQALKILAALVAAGCAPIKPEHNEAAVRLAEESTSVDLHSHPGMLPSSPLSVEGQLDRMQRGKVRASLFAAVADGPVIGRRPSGGLYASRSPRPGELYGYTYRSLDSIRARAAAGKLVLIQSPADLEASRAQAKPGALLAVEGGDFLEGKLERVQEAYERGVRSIQLTHYRVNELGDIQTDPPVHGGLTPFGLDVIREMNRLGMVIDVAHLTLDGVRHAVGVTRKPLLLSHTVLQTNFARSISAEHGRLIARTGGVIGIFPVNSGGYGGFAGYVEHIVRMIKAVGVDHVGVGTDMDGISPPSFLAWSDYSEWPSLAGALLAQGYSREDVAKVIGGNFLRVYRGSAAA